MKSIKAVLIIFVFLMSNSNAFIKSLDHGTLESISDSSFVAITYRDGKLPIPNKAGIYKITYKNILIDTSNNYIYVGASYYPIKIVLNGNNIYEWGTLDKNGGMANYSSSVITIPKALINNTNTIELFFWTDGLKIELPQLIIGDSKKLIIKSEIENWFNNTGLKTIILISLIISIAFFFVSFFVYDDKNILRLFATFSFFFVFAFQIFAINNPYVDGLLQIKITRIFTILMPISLFILTSQYTGMLDYKNRSIILYGLTLLPIIHIAGMGSKFEVDEFMKLMKPLFYTPTMITSTIILLINFIKKKSIFDLVFFIDFILIFYASYNDLSFASNYKIPSIWLIPYSIMLLIVTIFIKVILNHLRLYKENISISKKLQESHNELELKNFALESANKKIADNIKQKESFIRTISHELRTPVTGLLGGIDNIVRDENIPPHLKLPLKNINHSFRRLYITLSNLFSYVDIQNGTIKSVSNTFSVREIIDPLLDFYTTKAAAKHISFIKLINDNRLPKYLYGDSEHLLQIIDNLLSNAIKFTSNGGVSICIDYLDEVLSIEISDTGEGISEEKQKQLFQSFQNDKNFSFTKKYEGIGLGLSIINELVIAMDGKIEFESQKGKGTNFKLSFKMLKSTQNKKIDKHQFSILIVEDNSVNSLVLTKHLEREGYQTKAAYDGVEAVKMCKKHHFNAILMDIQMPKMDGLEATKKIRKFLPYTPIIAITANGDPETCKDAGMNMFLLKPIPTDKLSSILLDVIEKSMEA